MQRSWQTLAPLWSRLTYVSRRSASTRPPEARPYRPGLRGELEARQPPQPLEPPEPAKKSFWSRLSPFGAPVLDTGPKDPERGAEAARRVVKEGVLDPRYKNAARTYTTLIVSSTLAIGLSFELYKRRFRGAAQKPIPAKRVREPEEEVEGQPR